MTDLPARAGGEGQRRRRCSPGGWSVETFTVELDNE